MCDWSLDIPNTIYICSVDCILLLLDGQGQRALPHLATWAHASAHALSGDAQGMGRDGEMYCDAKLTRGSQFMYMRMPTALLSCRKFMRAPTDGASATPLSL